MCLKADDLPFLSQACLVASCNSQGPILQDALQHRECICGSLWRAEGSLNKVSMPAPRGAADCSPHGSVSLRVIMLRCLQPRHKFLKGRTTQHMLAACRYVQDGISRPAIQCKGAALFAATLTHQHCFASDLRHSCSPRCALSSLWSIHMWPPLDGGAMSIARIPCHKNPHK